jgi:hypothetical protein
MPALLSLLRVDDIAAATAPTAAATAASTQHEHEQKHEQSRQQQPKLPLPLGGMDWGVVAVYSCAASCARGTQEWVAVQPPVGEEEEEEVIG